jgi:transcriptional/translational regulatory protein YebC/TACO1
MEVLTKPNKLQDTVDIFELEDIEILKSMVIWKPNALLPINDDDMITAVLGLMDEVTALEGIVNVTADFWIPDDKLEKLL